MVATLFHLIFWFSKFPTCLCLGSFRPRLALTVAHPRDSKGMEAETWISRTRSLSRALSASLPQSTSNSLIRLPPSTLCLCEHTPWMCSRVPTDLRTEIHPDPDNSPYLSLLLHNNCNTPPLRKSGYDVILREK